MHAEVFQILWWNLHTDRPLSVTTKLVSQWSSWSWQLRLLARKVFSLTLVVMITVMPTLSSLAALKVVSWLFHGREGFRSGFSQCVLTKNNYVSGDRKTRKLMLIPILKYLTWYHFTIWGIQWEIFHQWWQNTLLYNVGYTALLIWQFELFYAINYDLLMLFRRSILVLCHQHQS